MNATVTRFNAWSWADWGQGFVILPEERQQGSLEFQTYSNHVANGLQQVGYRPFPSQDLAKAFYVVFLDYSTGPAKTEIDYIENPRPPFMGGGFGSSSKRSGVFFGLPFSAHDDIERITTTFYPHILSVKIFDGQTFRTGQKNVVFEGRATMDSTSPSLAQAMPYLAQALFQKFPGQSGETVTVNLPTRR